MSSSSPPRSSRIEDENFPKENFGVTTLALVPLSLIFELVFYFLAIILYRENLTLERLVAVGLLFFEIPLLTANQQFITDASGALAVSSIAIPTTLLGYAVFANFLLIFIALYRWWDLYDAQKKAKEATAGP